MLLHPPNDHTDVPSFLEQKTPTKVLASHYLGWLDYDYVIFRQVRATVFGSEGGDFNIFVSTLSIDVDHSNNLTTRNETDNS